MKKPSQIAKRARHGDDPVIKTFQQKDLPDHLCAECKPAAGDKA
jgi:hypothetical protein